MEAKLEEHPEQLMRSAVELAKLWRQDKALRFLQAEILVADKNTTLVVSGEKEEKQRRILIIIIIIISI